MSARSAAASRRSVLLMGAAAAVLASTPVLAQAKPRIGFIGAGHIGSTLAKLWADAGYQVMLSARNLDPVKALAAQLGPNAKVGTPAEAATFGDVVVVTVPYNQLPAVGRDYAAQLKGKIVIDTCNPNVTRDGDMTKDAFEKGTGVMDPIYLPGTRLVRAFNSISYASIASNAHRAGVPVGIELAADDKRALAVVEKLVSDAGFEPVVVGGLETAKLFDAGTPVYPKTMTAAEMRAALNLK